VLGEDLGELGLGLDELAGANLDVGDLPADPAVMLERQPMEALVRDRELHAFKHEGFWQPMDTLRERKALLDAASAAVIRVRTMPRRKR